MLSLEILIFSNILKLFKSGCILTWLFLFSTAAYSQSPGFVSYSVRDGLAQSNVVDIAEDQFGNLWLATSGGLSKFNGVEFTNYKKHHGLAGNRISCLTVDGNGNIWVGTDAGISSFNGKEFENYPEIGLKKNQYVNHIKADPQEGIWFSISSGGVGLLRSDKKTASFDRLSIVPTGLISGFAKTTEGIWIATKDNGLYHYKDHHFEPVDLPDLKQLKITALVADQNNGLWFGTSSGLFHWSGKELKFMHSFHNSSPDFTIYSISEEYEGAIWVGTTKGAFRYEEGFCTSVNSSDGLTDNIIYKIHKDREGTLWYGSFGDGLYKSLGEAFTHIGKDHGLKYDYISSISQGSKRDYWFGSYGGGIYHYNPPDGPERSFTINNLNHTDGLSNDLVYGTAMDNKGRLWVATAMGLNHYKNGRFTNYFMEHGLPSNEILSILSCQDGSIYCGTTNGLTSIKPENDPKFTNYSYPGDLTDNRVRTMIETNDGRILLGTNGGLKYFDGKKIMDYFQNDSLKHRPISAIYQDDSGGIWCALMDDGILFHNPANGKVVRYTEEDGLASNIVYSLATDQSGSVWVGTPHGLDKLRFNKSGGIQQIRHFNADDGFFGIETNTNAVYREEDGQIWFGTVEGVFKCDPSKIRLNTLEPITSITGIKLFSEKVNWDELADSTSSWFNIPENLKLSHKENHLTFEFFSNSLRNPKRVSYQYTLENFDRDWQPVTKKNEAVYTNLPPGQYVFKVKASNNDGVWNQLPAKISFEITPPFWRTWWFFSLTVLLLGLSGRLYYNYRVQKKLRSLLHVENIKNQEMLKLRKRVAEDFHDQVGNQLASITVLVQLIQAKLTSNKEVEELLTKLGQFTKTLFTGTRDFIWSIDPKSDNVNEMLIYIRDFGEELFEYSGVNFYVETNDAFDTKMKLPVGWSRHVVFIFKEALTNILKHADCKNVYMNFNVSDQNFVFELRDDGVGLNGFTDSEQLGMGFQNMKERALRIGGEIAISSDNGKGMTIILEGKLPQNEG